MWNTEVVYSRIIYYDIFILMPEVTIEHQNRNFNSIASTFRSYFRLLCQCNILTSVVLFICFFLFRFVLFCFCFDESCDAQNNQLIKRLSTTQKPSVNTNKSESLWTLLQVYNLQWPCCILFQANIGLNLLHLFFKFVRLLLFLLLFCLSVHSFLFCFSWIPHENYY